MKSNYELEIEKGSKTKHVFTLGIGDRVKINEARTYTLTENAILIVDVPDFKKMQRDPRVKAMVAAYRRSKKVTNDKT